MGFRCPVSWPRLTAHLKATDCPGVWNKKPTGLWNNKPTCHHCFFLSFSFRLVILLVEVLSERARGGGARQWCCSLSALLHDCSRIPEQQESLQMVPAATHTVCIKQKQSGQNPVGCSWLFAVSCTCLSLGLSGLSPLWRWVVPFCWFWCYQVLSSMCRMKQTSPVGHCKESTNRSSPQHWALSL